MKHTSIILGFLFSSVLGPVLASTSPVILAGDVVIVDSGPRYVQAATLPTLAPSALRRLTFYSDKAIISLFDLANEDSAAGQNGATISTDTTDKLRNSIERLLEAGNKADLSVDQVALFFAQEVTVRFSGPVPVILQGPDGEIDAQTLFRGIALAQASAKAPVANADFLSMLAAESADMSSTGGTAPAPDATPDVADEERDPVIQAIVDRATTSGGQRAMVVIQGDTLAGYAQAFYGDTLRYRTIFLANASILSNPNLLTVGQTIIVPAN